jgi:nucleoid-associated protein YgaU
MGLFSFLKSAGASLLGNKAKENEVAAAADAAAEKANKVNLLSSIVKGSGIAINDFSLDLDNDKVTVYGSTTSTSDKEKVILMLGNVEGIATVDDRISVVEPPSVFYEVKSGDSLSKIAKAHYGDAMKYNTIFEANQPMLSHPDKIYPGQMLRIPRID